MAMILTAADHGAWGLSVDARRRWFASRSAVDVEAKMGAPAAWLLAVELPANAA
jgi:hypothetical protein